MKFRGGMGELMRQASRLQRKVERRKEELKDEPVEATAGNDRVKAVVNGNGDLLRIEIDPALLEQEGLALVQDLVVAAVNAALTKQKQLVETEVEKVTGGLKLPGTL